MRVDHIGYAVKDIQKSIIQFTNLGYEFEPIVCDSERNIDICFGNLGEYRIELVSPIANGEVSPVDNYVKHFVNIPYHICYESDQFEEDLKNLCKDGLKIIAPPKTACAFGGRRVAFLYGVAMGLLEIVEK